MSVAQEIDIFFRSTNQRIFIEVEAKESRIVNFIRDYNMHYQPNIRIDDEGIISLDENANKWGLELRCYFSNKEGFPKRIPITNNRAYRAEYPYRFNDVDVIKELFELGYHIGLN